MLIGEAIDGIKSYCRGVDFVSGEPIDDATTRDKVTYGAEHLGEPCTGIVTCIWPTADIIRRAGELGANLIVSHEALFWNHGDRQDVIAHNKTYFAKKALLDEWGGTVWRCHDYSHSKVPIDEGGRYVDGIFYGFAWKLGWLDYRCEDVPMSLDFKIPQTSGRKLAQHIVRSLGLNGTRLIGDPDARVSRIHVPMHVTGDAASDTREISYADANDVDALVTMEFVDFTTSEYIRDAGMLGQNKCAITVGHFNLEEPGMEYMTHWVHEALGNDELPVSFAPMHDTYQYVCA